MLDRIMDREDDYTVVIMLLVLAVLGGLIYLVFAVKQLHRRLHPKNVKWGKCSSLGFLFLFFIIFLQLILVAVSVDAVRNKRILDAEMVLVISSLTSMVLFVTCVYLSTATEKKDPLPLWN